MAGFGIRTRGEKRRLALLLALVGGFVDAVGYLVLLRMFTAHMSGNSIAMGIHFGQADLADALHRGFPIPVYVLGVAVGAVLHDVLIRRHRPSAFAPGLGLEALLLLLFAALGPFALGDGRDGRFYLLAALPALAMGVQNATLRRVGGKTVRTTYITGMLTDLAEDGVTYLFWLYDQVRSGQRTPAALVRPSLGQPSFRRMFLYLGLWLAYVLGAIVGTLARSRWGAACLAAPAGCLLVVVVADLVRPIAPPQPAH